MPTFEAWAVVKVPFPYTDQPIVQRRPALVLATLSPADGHALLWVAMITSAAHRRWDGDVAIDDLTTAGLPARSVVRPAKVATIDARNAQRIGILPKAQRIAVREWIRTALHAL